MIERSYWSTHISPQLLVVDCLLNAPLFTCCADLFFVVKSQLSANSRRLRDYYALPLSHQSLLDSLGWRKKIDLVDERIEANSRFLRAVVDYPEIFDEGERHHGTEAARPEQSEPIIEDDEMTGE